MVRLPIKFPQWWPPLVVTSYSRKKGSHSSGKAIDITLQWKRDRGPKSHYWFYYFATFDALFRAQRSGVTRISIPTQCPHYHIELNPDVNKFGWELNQYQYDPVEKRKHCMNDSYLDASKNNSDDRDNMVDFLRNKVYDMHGIDWLEYQKLSLLALKDRNDAYLPVSNPDSGRSDGISDSELQNWLDFQYTDSTLKQIGDFVTQTFSDKPNFSKAAEDARDTALLWGFLGVAGYVGFRWLERKLDKL